MSVREKERERWRDRERKRGIRKVKGLWIIVQGLGFGIEGSGEEL